MGDRLWAAIPPRYVTKPTRSTQPCILNNTAVAPASEFEAVIVVLCFPYQTVYSDGKRLLAKKGCDSVGLENKRQSFHLWVKRLGMAGVICRKHEHVLQNNMQALSLTLI